MTDHHDHSHGREHQHGAATSTGVHGMVLFGDDATYLSHLPMFASPHNFQVLLEVELAGDARDTYLADLADADGGLYTFVPDPFPIVEIDDRAGDPQRTSMRGSVFRGHFERGGVSIADDITVEIRGVVHFSELDIDASRPVDRTLTYLCFGRAGRLHLVHQVTGRPDFDHVIELALVADTVTDQAGRAQPDDVGSIEFGRAQPVSFDGRRDHPDDRLVPGEVADGLFFQATSDAGSQGFAAQVDVGTELYLEIDELA